MTSGFELILTKDGSPSVYSSFYKAAYHSLNGAAQESEHVYIKNGFKIAIQRFSRLKILEVGFGTGLNTFLTLQHGTGSSVYYHAIEKHPLPAAIFNALNPDQNFQLLHTAGWEKDIRLNPHFTFHKTLSDFKNFSGPDKYNLIYYDAFSPEDQPELWQSDALSKLHSLLDPGGILVTYCAQGKFKRQLKSLGFTVESPAGAAGKREMTRATKAF